MEKVAVMSKAVGVQALACFVRSPGVLVSKANSATGQPKGWNPTFLVLLILAHSSTADLLAGD
ncbi:MAG TPA: hypothetical protein VM452_06875, partial [Caulifigura sp.]|nr:hypothetical protein [Caulifigura sp.]